MFEVLTNETQNKLSPFLLSLRAVTWIIPIALWVIHLLIIVPTLNTLSGDAKFLTAMQFYMISGLLMILCLLASLIIFQKNRSWSNLLPIVMNLSWIYYVKVLVLGPTFGNL